MNMISELRQRVLKYGTATITAEDFDQLQAEWITRAGISTPSAESAPICRDDGRCQYAIDHGAEGLGHCPPGKCCMPVESSATPLSESDELARLITISYTIKPEAAREIIALCQKHFQPTIPEERITDYELVTLWDRTADTVPLTDWSKQDKTGEIIAFGRALLTREATGGKQACTPARGMDR